MVDCIIDAVDRTRRSISDGCMREDGAILRLWPATSVLLFTLDRKLVNTICRTSVRV